MNLAEKIIKYRTEHRLSQKAFADLVETTQSHINRLEKGKPYRATTERRILNVIEKE